MYAAIYPHSSRNYRAYYMSGLVSGTRIYVTQDTDLEIYDGFGLQNSLNN